MMRILILEGEASNKLGGAEMSMFSFIEYLNKKEDEVFLAYQFEGDWLEPENSILFAKTKKIDISSPRAQGFLSYINEIKTFVRYCKSNDIDLIVTHTIHGFVFLRIAKLVLKSPIICFFKWQFSKESIGFFNKWGIKCIDLAISTPSIADYWKRNGVKPQYGFHELYNGIRCDTPYTTNSDKKYEIERLVFFGRITKEKGVLLLLEAAFRLKHIKIDFYGKFNPNENEFHAELTSLVLKKELKDRISFCGFVSDPIDTMKMYDLVVVPSLTFEAQGRVLFEAMCATRLVIASKIGGMPDILGDYKELLTFEPCLGGLLNCIKQVSELESHDIERIKHYYKKRFHEKFTEEVTHEKLHNYLKGIYNNDVNSIL
jgi:glycosyltransferase involved in cell wall biosynthesis